MPTRPATYPDLLPASHLLASAFHNDPMFGPFVHPHRNEFPSDVHLYWLRFLREAYYTPSEHLIVSYVENSSQPQSQTITGIAHWIRNHANPPAASYVSQISLKAIQTFNAAGELLWPNRALDAANDAFIPLGNPFFEHHWSGSRADSWHLSLLGVDPECEKQGFGRALVAWGFEQSVREGVSCSVISVPGQERFYGKCGFDVTVGTTNDEGGEANAWKAAGLEAMPVMFCDFGREVGGLRRYGE